MISLKLYGLIFFEKPKHSILSFLHTYFCANIGILHCGGKKEQKKRAPLRLYDRHLQARLLNEAERASIEYVRTIRTRQYNGTFCFGYGVSGKVCKFYRFIPDNCQKSSGLNPEYIRYIRKTGNASCFLRMPDKKSEFLFQYSCRKENEALKIKIFCPRKQKWFAKTFPDIILI